LPQPEQSIAPHDDGIASSRITARSFPFTGRHKSSLLRARHALPVLVAPFWLGAIPRLVLFFAIPTVRLGEGFVVSLATAGSLPCRVCAARA